MQSISPNPRSTCNDSIGRAAFGSSDGHWEWRLLDDEVWCSAPLLNLLGEADSLPTMSFEAFLALLHPEDVDGVEQGMAGCTEVGDRFEADFRVRGGEDGVRWCHAKASALPGDDGRLAYVSGRLRDVTREHAAAEQQRLKDHQLIQQQRMNALDCLAGGIAHEFNNVLQAVRGYVAFAMDELEEGDQAHSDLKQALSATDRAAGLTRSLLDFARAEEPVDERYQISDEVAAVEALLRPILGEHIAFETHVTGRAMICTADSQGLRQSLLNLCINARDAMPDGGQMVLTAEPLVIDEALHAVLPSLAPGEYCRLRVTDSGSGIEKRCLEKIFDPFFSTKEVGRGTGLGLATVYGFVKRSGGHVEVYSEAGRGTAFCIYLPIEELSGMGYETIRSEDRAEGAPLVLLVEDDHQVSEVGRRSLESAGYRVLVAADGEAGLECYIENVDEVALVVLDVVLPRLSGRRVFEEIRRLQSNVPVIFTTGFDPFSSAGAKDGQLADMTIAKPYDRRQLLESVQGLLAARIEKPALKAGQL